jgi:hypothetical protein
MQQAATQSRRASTLCLGALIFAALTASAGAQVTSAQQSALRSNCRSDFQSHCSGVTPGGKDALACLQNNVAKLSAACQTAVRATLPKEPVQAAKPPAAPPPPPAAVAPPPKAPEKPATIVSAPPPKAQPAKRPVTHPSQAAVAPVQTPPAAAPAASAQPAAVPAMVPGGALVEKACARYILMNCRGTGLGTGPKVACMVNFVNAGNFVGPRCRAALTVTGQLR